MFNAISGKRFEIKISVLFHRAAKAPAVLLTLQLRLPFDFNQFHLKDQNRIRWDFFAGASRSISQLRRNNQLALLAFTHVQQALVPPLDDLAHAEGER